MVGNILAYIWDKFSSLFSLFTFGRGETDEDAWKIVKPEDEISACEQRTRVNREVVGQSHEKVLSKIPRDEYAHMVERLSTRYELSENVTSQMLQIMDNDVRCDEYSWEDNKYSVVVVKRETDFDVKLFRANITKYAREQAVCIE